MERREQTLADKLKLSNRIRDIAIGIVVGGAAGLISVALRPAQAVVEPIPVQQFITGLCFSIGQPDLTHHTPAYWIEQQALKGMSHTTRGSLRCKLDVDGKQIVADLNQIMVARFGKGVKSTH